MVDPQALRSQIEVEARGTTHRAKILMHFVCRSHYGATCAEVVLALGIRHQTAAPRILELRNDGLLTDSGYQRRTSSGRYATVWTVPLTPYGDAPRGVDRPRPIQGSPDAP